RVANLNGPAKRFCACADHSNRLRMAIGIDEECRWSSRRDTPRHCHGFGGGGAFIEQRGISDGKAGKINDHSLEIQERLETTLTDFRLIWGVSGIPSRAFQNIALDHRWEDGVVIALSNQRNHFGIARREDFHLFQQLGFRKWSTQLKWIFLTDAARQRLI